MQAEVERLPGKLWASAQTRLRLEAPALSFCAESAESREHFAAEELKKYYRL